MNLSSNSWHYKFFILTQGKRPDDNFCNYFWLSILGLITLPFSWPLIALYSIFAYFDEKTKEVFKKGECVTIHLSFFDRYLKFGGSWLVNSLIGGVTQLLITLLIIAIVSNLTVALKAFGIVILIAIGTGLFFYLGGKWMQSNTKANISKNVTEISKIVSEGFKSLKDKYCPRIFWDFENQ